MEIVIIPIIVFVIATAMLFARSMISMRKRLTNVEEAKKRLKAGWEARLRGEEGKRRELEGKLCKAEEDYNRLEQELKRRAKEEEEQNCFRKEHEQREKGERETREIIEKEKLGHVEEELRQSRNKLSQAEEQKRHFTDDLQKVEKENARIEEEGKQKLEEEKERWKTEKEMWDEAEREMKARLEAQNQEFAERIQKAEEERNCFKETIRDLVKDIKELLKKQEKEHWKSEIEERDKARKEMTEKFEAERRILAEKLLKAEEDRKYIEEEIKWQVKEREEQLRQQAEQEQRRRGEEEKLKKGQEEVIDQLEAEHRQLKEIVAKVEEESLRLKEELKKAKEQVPGKQEIGDTAKKERLDRLEDLCQQLEQRLSESEKKRKRLITKLRQIEPKDRGGHPRGSVEKEGGNGTLKPKTRSLKPEIICWKEGWSWVVGVEVPEELEVQSVSQNGLSLECDAVNGNRYRFKQAKDRVEITWSGGEETISLLKSERNYLVFKMRNDWRGPGRSVRYSTAGYYLVIAPKDWERDVEISREASVTPESTQIEGFRAHFFYQEKAEGTAIGLITLDGNRMQVTSKKARFKLLGNEVCDASEDKGPLFGEQPPRILALDLTKEWSDVGVIVVGEEGSGRNRWRSSFVPDVSVREQKALDGLINGRSGWYFLRIYDKDDGLIESMDFRFLQSLHDIRIENNTNCLPGPAGHESIIARILHHPDCKVDLMNKDKQDILEVHQENGQTAITVPPRPDCDKTNWILSDDSGEVEVTILAERIWWAISTLDAVPNTWTGNPMPLSRKDFSAITDKAIWLRLPRARFTRRIDVGFDRTNSRFYQVEVGKKELSLPLREFCDCEQIRNPKQECLIHLFIVSSGTSYSAPVCNVVASFRCKNCQFITSSEQEVLSHIGVHLSGLIPHLNLEELRRRLKWVLPHEIYKCHYCGFYVKTDDLENPTSAICLHIQQECREAFRINGPPQIRFSVISDIDEIRGNVIPNLPHIYQCRICNKEFQGDDREFRLNHLQNSHRGQLFQLF